MMDLKSCHNSGNCPQFVVSYSGGKDSTLALYKAMQEGTAVALISMLRTEDGLAGAHAVPKTILQAQAEAMGIPLLTFTTDWNQYEAGLLDCLKRAKSMGAETLVTGDIDLPEQNCWYENVTKKVGVSLFVPLWQWDRKKVVAEFLKLGFVSKIVSVDPSKGMQQSDLGRILTTEYLAELEDRGIDCCGESGEFHTIVFDGPIFQKPLKVREGKQFSIGRNLCIELEVF